MSAIAKIQEILGVEPDSIWGPKTQAALDFLIEAYREDDEWTSATATSFADPADIAAFNRCKAKGNSDSYCFRYGDNGVGTPALGGLSTVEGTGPAVALPSKRWKQFGSSAKQKKLIVRKGDREVVCELRDTSGSRDVIDLNPDACAALGLTPPVKTKVEWRWV